MCITTSGYFMPYKYFLYCRNKELCKSQHRSILCYSLHMSDHRIHIESGTLRLLFMALVSACLFCYPLLSSPFLHIGHDHFFHLSRIAGLAEALQRGDLLPVLYPLKNNGFGYASPAFYNDILLTPFALMYLLGIPLSSAYKAAVITSIFFGYISMYSLIREVYGKEAGAHITAMAYTFCCYHMTDVYIRGAFGEVTAFIFFPYVFLGLYRIFIKNRSGKVYAAGMTGLILSHNLTFIFACVITVIFFLLYRKTCTWKQLHSLFVALLFSFLLTVWFTLPMIEQLSSQELIVDYYAAGSDLSAQALSFADLLADTLRTPSDFLTCTGLSLLLLSLLSLFPDKKCARFTRICRTIGIVCLLLPLKYVPWKYLFFLRVIQFPWRLMIIATTALCLPAGYALSRIKRPAVLIFAGLLVLSEHVYHLVTMHNDSWNFGITSSVTYDDITSGKVIDPYYSAHYMRVELAGGDYLPLHTVDFRTYTPEIRDGSGNILPVSFTREGTSITFTVPQEYTGQTLILPLTWYKGYQAEMISAAGKEKLSVLRSEQALVSVHIEKAGQYRVAYQLTPLALACRILSLLTVLYLLYRSIVSRSSGMMHRLPK